MFRLTFDFGDKTVVKWIHTKEELINFIKNPRPGGITGLAIETKTLPAVWCGGVRLRWKQRMNTIPLFDIKDEVKSLVEPEEINRLWDNIRST